MQMADLQNPRKIVLPILIKNVFDNGYDVPRLSITYEIKYSHHGCETYNTKINEINEEDGNRVLLVEVLNYLCDSSSNRAFQFFTRSWW